MAIRLTSSRLRQIIQEERARLAPRQRALREAFSYSTKLTYLQDALDALEEAQVHERHSDIGSDPDLDELVEAVRGYMEAVQVMADQEEPAPLKDMPALVARRGAAFADPTRQAWKH